MKINVYFPHGLVERKKYSNVIKYFGVYFLKLYHSHPNFWSKIDI